MENILMKIVSYCLHIHGGVVDRRFPSHFQQQVADVDNPNFNLLKSKVQSRHMVYDSVSNFNFSKTRTGGQLAVNRSAGVAPYVNDRNRISE